MSTTVLVTGGTGFVGTHALLRLLADGHQVRTTVRNNSRGQQLQQLLLRQGADLDRLTIKAADLTGDTGWAEAVHGCDVALHMASPFPPSAPRDPDELIVPAREGTLRVLTAARDAGVRRVVLTSSFAAVGYTPKGDGTPYTEADWTSPDGQPPYIASKVLAERASWEFVADGRGPELTVINPTGIFGPALGHDYSSSLGLIRQLLDGAMPGTPDLAFGIVDVRDVVDAHVRAMNLPEAAGQRFLAVSRAPVTMHQIALMLREGLGSDAAKVPTRQLPSWLVRGMAIIRPQLRPMVSELGIRKQISSEKARSILGWAPRPVEQTITDTGRSLIELAQTGQAPHESNKTGL